MSLSHFDLLLCSASLACDILLISELPLENGELVQLPLAKHELPLKLWVNYHSHVSFLLPSLSAAIHLSLHSRLLLLLMLFIILIFIYSSLFLLHVPFLSHLCNEFIVCNLVDRSEIRLHGLDISATFFHPWSLLGTFISLNFCSQSSCLVLLLAKESLSYFSYATA